MPNNVLTLKKLKAISLLATGTNISTVAKELGVDRSSVYRWTKEDLFIIHLNKLKTEQLNAARTQIQHSAALAIDTLSSIMKNSKNDLAKISAATKILEMAGMTKETSQLYGVGIGATSNKEIQAEKETKMLMDALSGNLY